MPTPISLGSEYQGKASLERSASDTDPKTSRALRSPETHRGELLGTIDDGDRSISGA